MFTLFKYKRKVYFTLGMSTTISGCFTIKALTHRQMYLKICAKIYDLKAEHKQDVQIVRIETLQEVLTVGKSNVLYRVFAGETSTTMHCVYETTKRSKAESYAHDLTKQDNNYNKIYITSKPLSNFDKRQDWEDD